MYQPLCALCTVRLGGLPFRLTSVARESRTGRWPTFDDVCVRHSNRGCPILACFARVGSDAGCGFCFATVPCREQLTCAGIPDSRPSQRTRRTAHSLRWRCRQDQKPGPPGIQSRLEPTKRELYETLIGLPPGAQSQLPPSQCGHSDLWRPHAPITSLLRVAIPHRRPCSTNLNHGRACAARGRCSGSRLR
jgi:hypothetical protein